MKCDHSIKFDWENESAWVINNSLTDGRDLRGATGFLESMHSKRQDNILAQKLLQLLTDRDDKLRSLIINYKPLAPWDKDNDNEYSYYINYCRQEYVPDNFFGTTLFSDILYSIMYESIPYDHIIRELYDYVINSYMFGTPSNDIQKFFSRYLYSTYDVWKYFTDPCRPWYAGTFEHLYCAIINFIKFVIKSGLVDIDYVSIKKNFDRILKDIDGVVDSEIIKMSKLEDIASAIKTYGS